MGMHLHTRATQGTERTGCSKSPQCRIGGQFSMLPFAAAPAQRYPASALGRQKWRLGSSSWKESDGQVVLGAQGGGGQGESWANAGEVHWPLGVRQPLGRGHRCTPQGIKVFHITDTDAVVKSIPKHFVLHFFVALERKEEQWTAASVVPGFCTLFAPRGTNFSLVHCKAA